MVRCRNWELLQVCPCGAISTGGDLAVTQQFGEQGGSIPEALCVLLRRTLLLRPGCRGSLDSLRLCLPCTAPNPTVVSKCLGFPVGMEGDNTGMLER